MQIEVQQLSQNPPGLQHQTGTAETSSLADHVPDCYQVLSLSGVRQPLLDYLDHILWVSLNTSFYTHTHTHTHTHTQVRVRSVCVCVCVSTL